MYVIPTASNPSYLGGRGRRITILRPVQAKVSGRPYLKNKIKAKGLRASPHDRAPTYHGQGPGFNPQYHKRKKMG
jgi:hypothetical protein